MRTASGGSESRFLRNRHSSIDPTDGYGEDLETRPEQPSDAGATLSPPTSFDTCITRSSAETEAPYLDESESPESKKESAAIDGVAEIDAVVTCLTLAGRWFVRESPNGAGRSVASLRIALTLLFCGAVALLLFSSTAQSSVRSSLNFNPDRVFSLGRSQPQLPILGAVCTHHRTGTVLFLSVTEQWCSAFSMDYERIEVPFVLKNPAMAETMEYQHYYGAKEKLMVGMHGFTEHCAQLEMDECGVFDWNCWLAACHITQQQKGRELPVVHVVRNPVEILISAYLYHQKEPVPEGWLQQPKPDALLLLPEDVQLEMLDVPYYKILQELPPEQGLRVEFRVEHEELLRMTRNYRDLPMLGSGINLKYEDLLADYEGVMERVVHHLGLSEKFSHDEAMKIAMKQNLHNMSAFLRKDYGVELHVTEGTRNKTMLREVLYSDPEMCEMLEALAHVLDYPDPFPRPCANKSVT